MDLTAVTKSFDPITGNTTYGTGLAFEIPEGYVGLLFPRSSVSKTDMFLTNCVGVIDSGYRGEVMVKFKNTIRIPEFRGLNKIKKLFNLKASMRIQNAGVEYEVGERVCQLVILPVAVVQLEQLASLPITTRGSGGFGSTGS